MTHLYLCHVLIRKKFYLNRLRIRVTPFLIQDDDNTVTDQDKNLLTLIVTSNFFSTLLIFDYKARGELNMFAKLAFISFLIFIEALENCVDSDCDNGVLSQKGRIMGGDITMPNSRPFQVNVI